MAVISPKNDAANALQLLTVAGESRKAEINKYQAQLIIVDADKENDSKSTVYDSIYNVVGSQKITQRANYTLQEFIKL